MAKPMVQFLLIQYCCNTIIFYADAKDWYNINEGDMPPCQRMPCRNDGVCIPHRDNVHGYTCNCTTGFGGMNCETHIACESESCNGGECIPKASNPLDFFCLCPFGRVGVQCQTGGYKTEPYIKTLDHSWKYGTLNLPSCAKKYTCMPGGMCLAPDIHVHFFVKSGNFRVSYIVYFHEAQMDYYETLHL